MTKETYEIAVHGYAKTGWIDLNPLADTEVDSVPQLLCSSLCICMVDL